MTKTSGHTKNATRVALIGFGEAAQAFARGWRDIGVYISAYDIKTQVAGQKDDPFSPYRAAGVTGCHSPVLAVTNANAVFSLVTADQALVAADSVVDGLPDGCLYFDCNSCAPATKTAAAAKVNAAGGRYVDVAVMAPVFPALHRTPVLISGEHAAAALPVMTRLGMVVTVIDGPVGRASTIKMIRSVMMKGLEALVAECVLAGRIAGVEQIVLDSLDKTYPGFDWTGRAAHMLDRMKVHGHRRAAEMREVALTVEQLGLNNALSLASADWQQAIGDLALAPSDGDLKSQADEILAALPKRGS